MISVLEGGAYLLDGTQIIPDHKDASKEIKSRTGREISRQEARKGTIAYGILEAHNTSGNMEKLKIRFDKLTSHDITFVGIIQTARASGLERFPVPYVLTNCHNSLCAVGGTIRPHLRQEIRRRIRASSSGGDSSICKRDACGRRKNDTGL